MSRKFESLDIIRYSSIIIQVPESPLNRDPDIDVADFSPNKLARLKEQQYLARRLNFNLSSLMEYYTPEIKLRSTKWIEKGKFTSEKAKTVS